MQENNELTQEEVLELATVDPIFYSHHFFPKTMRMPSSRMHHIVWDALESPGRLVNIQIFRGGAKTSLLRVFTSRRIAFGVSNTIVYIGKSEGSAIRSVDWLRRQVLFKNPGWTSFFGLRKGERFQGVEAEIYHEGLKTSIWLVGVGIEGSVRGINLDDYRPDLIILDDVITEDNTASAESRKALEELILGAVVESLAAPGEAPHAKVVMLSTPQHKEDPSMKALKDPEWKSVRVGCWTPETENLPLAERLSIWPEMFPSVTLRTQKTHAVERNLAHIFTREKEVKLVDSTTTAFRPLWLRRESLLPERNDLDDCIVCIDPVPKPTEKQLAKGLHKKDFEVHQVWGRIKGDYYCLDWERSKGHDPSWTKARFFKLLTRWRPRLLHMDGIAYQTTLAWILTEAMKEQGQYLPIFEDTDQRSKYDKIVDTLNGPGALGAIHVPEGYTEFFEQWNDYPDVSHDDDLDCAHMGVKQLSKMLTAAKAAGYNQLPAGTDLSQFRRCP